MSATLLQSRCSSQFKRRVTKIVEARNKERRKAGSADVNPFTESDFVRESVERHANEEEVRLNIDHKE